MNIRWDNRSLMLIGGLLVMASACAGRANVSNAVRASSAVAADSVVHVRVSNHQGTAMTVYAVGSGSVFRIGRALPELPSDFVVPRALMADGLVEFVAEGDGQAPVRTGQLQLAMGEVVQFTISTAGYSTAWIGRR